MIFDIFFSISQTDVDGYMPSEADLYRNFFAQVKAADELGFNTAWIAESHLSSEIQKLNPNPVIPNFKGEVGINVDFFQTATRVFQITKRINCGSAIMNILCNGGPIAAAERTRSFLAFHSLNENETRKIEIGFASGRFPYINKPHLPVRDQLEQAAWGPVMSNKILQEATEIFIRLIRGDIISSDDISPVYLEKKNYKNPDQWQKICNVAKSDDDKILLKKRYVFDKLQIVPREVNLKKHLNLIIGSHDPEMHFFANTFYPCGVFNLSITSSEIVEKTNDYMKQAYHKDGGEWSRDKMPRTVLVFINNDPSLNFEQQNLAAKEAANHTLEMYWKALEGTLDPVKVAQATDNALVGNPATILKQMETRFNKNDRLMLWFDFNNHNSQNVIDNMRNFMEFVASKINA